MGGGGDSLTSLAMPSKTFLYYQWRGGGGGSRPQLVDQNWDLMLMIITITNYVISIVP